jgi:hypothetical protein
MATGKIMSAPIAIRGIIQKTHKKIRAIHVTTESTKINLAKQHA